MTYEPELGQMVFGNAYSEHSLGSLEGYAADRLYNLSRILGERNPENQAHGLLGGEWGYGQDFDNETFEMHPYWWGDCECGYAEAEYEWDEANPHTDECWHTRWWAEHERLYALNLGWEEQGLLEDEWARTNGWDGRPGVGVYCDCYHAKAWREWSSSHGHAKRCRVVLPNFKCGDFEIRWYKYIGRGMSANRPTSAAELQAIFDRCEVSLR